MANYVLIHHKVKDFAQWKVGYDSDIARRTDATMIEKNVFRGADEGNDVTLLFEFRDLAKVKAVIESPGLKEAMQKFGVVSKPDFHFLVG